MAVVLEREREGFVDMMMLCLLGCLLGWERFECLFVFGVVQYRLSLLRLLVR